MAYLISGCIMFVLGAVVSTCFWLDHFHAREIGYNRGYEQARYEEGLRNPDPVVVQPTVFGMPSSEHI